MATPTTKPRSSLYQSITDQIIRELEHGTVPWHKPWSCGTLDGRVLHPLRYSGERYRGINIVSLWMTATSSGFTSPYWMTYRQALELGGQVRKGEKGAPVIYAGTLTQQDGDPADEAEARTLRFTKGYYVFNANQVDGLPERFRPVTAPPRLDPPLRDAQADAFFAATGIELRHGGVEAYYAGKSDHIQLPPIATFEDAAAYYATLSHESVHWTSHEKRLNRSFESGKRYGSSGYAMEELVAELGAAFLCADLQLTPQLRPDHASYVQNWLQVLKNDCRAIFAAAAHAQRACDYLHGLQLEPRR